MLYDQAVSLFQRIKTPFTEISDDLPAVPRSRSRWIGELLRDRREELELDLDTVGETLRIKPVYLAALEQGRVEETIRTKTVHYYRYLLDAEKLLQEVSYNGKVF